MPSCTLKQHNMSKGIDATMFPLRNLTSTKVWWRFAVIAGVFRKSSTLFLNFIFPIFPDLKQKLRMPSKVIAADLGFNVSVPVSWCQWTLCASSLLDPSVVLWNLKSPVDVKWFGWTTSVFSLYHWNQGELEYGLFSLWFFRMIWGFSNRDQTNKIY